MKLAGLCAAGLLLPLFCSAQELQQEVSLSPQFLTLESGGQVYELPQVLAPPQSGTFYSLQLTNFPPLPFNPFPEYPVYSFGDAFIFNDWEVDYVALKEQGFSLFGNTSSKLNQDSLAMESGVPSPPGEGGGGSEETTNNVPQAYSYTTNDLWLEITGVTNAAAYFTIHTPLTNGVYDLFNTTNLVADVPGLNLTNWIWILRSVAGQTNLVATNLPATQVESYYRLGTMLDSDSDGLTDAYETLVSHTDPNNPDTDGDGISDYWEWINGLSPFTSQAIPSLTSISIPVCPIP